MKKHSRAHKIRISKNILLFLCSLAVFIAAIGFIWLATLRLPDLNAFEQRKVTQSTKIYDRTGKIVLYDLHQNIKRTVVPFENISPFIKKATVAIEDDTFYSHKGIRPVAIVRAVTKTLLIKLNLRNGFTQGGSTITQQVIKNSLLTTDKTLTRKFKEWILALKLEKVLDKDSILGIYLNESPYGGAIYGVEEASQAYFGVTSADVTLAQAAYLAALPQSPTFYSPYGKNKKYLDDRKNLVLLRMKELGVITADDYSKAKSEVVTFRRMEERGIKAPHFVFFIRDYLVKKYGEEAVSEGGLKVITTLDYEMQLKAEEIVKKYALLNEKDMDAENAAMVALDPKTGQIYVMVGSRDYFDKDINGNFNVATALRQPGSTFKPFAYAEAFRKGFTPETALFDLKTEFSSECDALGVPKQPTATCYSPQNFDDKFRGPMTMREALAQSINIPAIKTLYLAGIGDTLKLAKDMGISNLGDQNQYGLTLVLGGGEVTPLDMTSAYGVFANQGLRNPDTGILEVFDATGRSLEKFTKNEDRVLEEDVALTISDVLSDNNARMAGYGPNSPLNFPGRDVAAKTGTTNDSRDAWIMGYTPSLVVGAWVGNNDNRPIKKNQTARLIVAPLWNEFMQNALKKLPDEKFPLPAAKDTTTYKPVLKGFWQGGVSYFVNKNSGQLATEFTPLELREEKVVTQVHSILHWLDKDNPLGAAPKNPSTDSQYEHWELPIREWAKKMGYTDQDPNNIIPKQSDNVHRPEYVPSIKVATPVNNSAIEYETPTTISFNSTSQFPIIKAEFYLNNSYLGSSETSPFTYSFIARDIDSVDRQESNTLKVVVTDSVGNKGEARATFLVR